MINACFEVECKISVGALSGSTWTVQAVPLLLTVMQLLLFFIVLAAITGTLLFMVSKAVSVRLCVTGSPETVEVRCVWLRLIVGLGCQHVQPNMVRMHVLYRRVFG